MNIADTITTPRHHDANRPFGVSPMIKPTVKPTDPDTLSISSDPLPAGRALPGCKYEPLFAQLAIGQCIKCKPDEVGRICGALRKWITTQPQGGMVRSIKNYGDGMGRVWWIAAQSKKREKSKSTNH